MRWTFFRYGKLAVLGQCVRIMKYVPTIEVGHFFGFGYIALVAKNYSRFKCIGKLNKIERWKSLILRNRPWAIMALGHHFISGAMNAIRQCWVYLGTAVE